MNHVYKSLLATIVLRQGIALLACKGSSEEQDGETNHCYSKGVKEDTRSRNWGTLHIPKSFIYITSRVES
jgi:hypothetical protein